MCGIAGIYHRAPRARSDEDLIRAMTDVLTHRGPDDGGVAMLGPAALGHRRLSILDLSPAGHQPMSTADGRLWITFNGEIYNYLSLRQELEAAGCRFRTHTDTEVLLELYRQLGPSCLEKLNGMFAFGIYDRTEHSLFLARDRLGKKPLYLWEDEGRLLFSSELKSFTLDPRFKGELELTALADYLGTLYIPDPKTIYRGITRLEPASYLRVTETHQDRRKYWWLQHFEVAEGSIGNERGWFQRKPPVKSQGRWALEEAIAQLEVVLRDAVRIRMIADVPLGAFLSGGVDSSLVVSEMARISQHPVRTTAMGFECAAEDESPFAAEVARAFGCDHQRQQVAVDAAGLLETLLWHFDEPFADSSALPTYLLSGITRGRVTVALSGDGGDEGFGGYDKYLSESRERTMRGRLPPGVWALLNQVAGAGFGRFERGSRTLGKGLRFLRTLAEGPARAYFRTQSFTHPEQVTGLLGPEMVSALEHYDPAALTVAAFEAAGASDPLSCLQSADFNTYLPGDILTKVDRMSMAHGLEVRCPLLDFRVVELAVALPPLLRMNQTEGKRVLKGALRKRLPKRLVDRPKHGFTIPVDAWFRGQLGPLFEDKVMAGGLRESGLLDMAAVGREFERHRSGREDLGMTLWTLLVLGMWYDRIRGRRAQTTTRGAALRVEHAV